MTACLTGCRELQDDEVVLDGERVQCPQCGAVVEVAVGISGRRFVARHQRPCRHVWSPVEDVPGCGTVHECVVPGCGAEVCLDDGAWADIATDDAVQAVKDEAAERREAQTRGW